MSSTAQARNKPLQASLEAGLDYPARTPTTFRYAIFSQQRTGSTWLCARLTNLGDFGVPHEYLNPLFAKVLGPRLGASDNPIAGGLDDYLRRVEAVRTAETGRFGIKVQPDQLFPLVRNNLDEARRFLQRFDAVIVLFRRRKLDQAISGALAEATSTWWNDGREPEVNEAQMRQMVRQTASYLGRYATEERKMVTVLRGLNRPRLNIAFEQIATDPEGSLQRVVAFLGGGAPAQPLAEAARMGTPERPPGRVAAELRARFMRFLDEGDVAQRPAGAPGAG